jgi:uncharacterized protein YqjF (DUF2071 family)
VITSKLFERVATASVEVRNFALVTHAVPADRVRPHLPSSYTLETFVEEGEERCLVSATCFCNHGFRWSATPYPKLTFDESTYRTYVTHRGRRGVYFLRRFLSRPLAFGPQRLFEANAALAHFEVETRVDESGYHAYVHRVQSGATHNHFSIKAVDDPSAIPPFDDGEEMAQHITYRLHGFFTASAGFQGHMPVSHRRMTPWAGELLSARFDTWTELGILEEHELTEAHSVLVEPLVQFRLHPPRPLL